MHKLAIIGVGQLGASVAMAVRQHLPQLQISGYDLAAQNSAYAQARGLLDEACDSIAQAVTDADIVLLACPLRSYPQVAAQLRGALKPGAIITDLGSVKQPMQIVADMLPEYAVVPAHPIAGGEQIGPQAASENLFKDKLLLLCPIAQSSAESVEIIAEFWESFGCIIMEMPLLIHDQIYAHVSHLPHAVAFVAAYFLRQQNIKIDENGDELLRQFLRIGASGARMWSDVFIENQLSILPPLASYIALLEHFVTELRSGQPGDTPPAQQAQILKAHLPRILAGVMISTVSLYEQQAGFEVRRFAAGGLRDIAAPVAIDPEQALAEMSANAGFLADNVEQIITYFRKLENLIGAQNAEDLQNYIEQMRLNVA
jgi:cyclohexadieny/prephenate dehydrogenase